MSTDDDGERRPEGMAEGNIGNKSLDVKNEKRIATTKNLPWIVDYALNESFIGLQIQKRKTYAQKELFEAVRLAQDELTRLEETPARLEKERLIQEDEFKNRKKDIAVKGLQLDLDQNRILKEIQEQKDAKEVLDLKKQLDILELQVKIADEKKKLAELEKTSRNEKEQGDPDKPAPDPHIEQARDGIRRYMERNRNLGADKKKWFAQIDADLARGELSEEMAENMKEDIEQMIRDSLLKP